MVAIMLVLRVVTGAPSLPELIQDQVLALIPGPAFSFVLDRLQFAAKPLLLVGLALLPVPMGAGLGLVYGRAWPRQGWFGRPSPGGGIAYGVLLWVILALTVAVSTEGVNEPVASAGSLLASSEVFGFSLVGFARLLQLATPRSAVDRGRRAVILGGLTGGALVLATGGLARILAFNTERASVEAALPKSENGASEPDPTAEAPADASADRMAVVIPPGVADEITPNERFYVVSKNFNDPRVLANNWSLHVSGLVDQPPQFSYDEILTLPTESQYTTLECISNTLGGKLMSNAYWTGVPLSRLLANVGTQPDAQAVVIRSADNYYESFPLDQVLAPGVLLAHTMNGAPLPDKHGFPLRLILPGPYGMKNPKWIVKIEVVAERIDGYWVRRGWDREAPVQTVARIDTPTDQAAVAGPRLEVGGVAFASDRGVRRVQASLDAGATWREARTRPPLGSSTWVQWAAEWENLSPGTYTVLARAGDGTGAFQTSDEHDSLPRGATGYHHIMFEVRA
jgi:DMSO/TMAO reductase YedYZ molybdopterin-dependent catalytic subunit